MFTFLLVVHAIIAAALVSVILMQRSEGGGLGMGGSPSGLMSARGAADFLTRATTVLATLFVLMSIGLAALATVQGGPRKIDASLARPGGGALPLPTAPTPTPAPGTAVPFEGDPLRSAATAVPDTAKPGEVPAASARKASGTRSASRRDGSGAASSEAGVPASSESATPASAAPADKPDAVPPAARPNSPSVPGAIETAPTGNSSAPQ